MLILLYSVLSKYTKINKQDIPSIGRNVLEFFCVRMQTEFLADFHEKYQVASTYYTNVEYQI